MKVSFSSRALKQFDEILAYISRENSPAANALIARVSELIALLSTRPGIGRPTDRRDVRVVSLGRYPYLLFYRVLATKDEIRVLRIRHMARR